MRNEHGISGFSIALIVSIALVAAPAHAVDGVVEINAAAATAGGVTPGDTPGFPITLSRSGSYRLTGNLSTGNRATTAILVTADDVQIDLGGFAIACTFATAFIPIGCLTGSSTGVGVDTEAGADRTVVRDGTVRSMGNDGVRLREGSSVESVRTFANGDDGIALGESGRVSDCTSNGNGGTGIQASFYSIVRDSVANENGEEGIRVESSGVVTGNVVRANAEEGIFASGALIQGNQVVGNGAAGIRCSNAGTVIGNRVVSNDGFGLQMTNCGYGENVMASNNNLLVSTDEVSGGVSLGINRCDGSLCP